MVATVNKKPTRPLTSRQEQFARMVANGSSQAEAWRRAYVKPEAKDKYAAEKSCKLAANPQVKARIAELGQKTVAAALLTVNDRLHKLASAMDFIPKTPGDRQALARLTDSYTKLAGGNQPLQVQLTGADGGAIQVAAAVTVTHRPVKERIAALRAARESRT